MAALLSLTCAETFQKSAIDMFAMISEQDNTCIIYKFLLLCHCPVSWSSRKQCYAILYVQYVQHMTKHITSTADLRFRFWAWCVKICLALQPKVFMCRCNHSRKSQFWSTKKSNVNVEWRMFRNEQPSRTWRIDQSNSRSTTQKAKQGYVPSSKDSDLWPPIHAISHISSSMWEIFIDKLDLRPGGCQMCIYCVTPEPTSGKYFTSRGTHLSLTI